ncbi:hypothetical protein C0J52_04137 [Blattella germanica]|nr:hypothetical protein C0J52_04137 [Blattella germanica]
MSMLVIVTFPILVREDGVTHFTEEVLFKVTGRDNGEGVIKLRDLINQPGLGPPCDVIAATPLHIFQHANAHPGPNNGNPQEEAVGT